MSRSGKILSIIPARSGSKGILRKNLVDFCGRPLLAWSISAAKAARGIDRVIVSTDSDEIATVAREWDAEVPYIRPLSLAKDNVHAVEVVLHALDFLEKVENYKPAGVMMLLPTSPLRLSSDIDSVIDLFHHKQASSVVSIVDLGKYMTNLRYLNGDSLVQVAPNEEPNAQRQGLNKLYAVNGSIFLARPDVLRQEGTFHIKGALGYRMSNFNSVDINSPDDLSQARFYGSTLDPWKSMAMGNYDTGIS